MITEYDNARLCLSLCALPRVGRKTAIRVLVALRRLPEDAASLCDAWSAIEVPGRALPSVDRLDAERAFLHADHVLGECRDHEIEAVPFGSSRLPDQFWAIPDPPLLVFLRGRVEALTEQPAVAIIGTRQPTEYGRKAATRFALRCAESGVTVVSGLALGCDAAAHAGCLEGGGVTVAVMAHGLDTVHPARHRELAFSMVDSGGALLSEYPPGTEPRPNQFVERDRLQSALASAVIVIETDVEGGTMHTVGFAKGQSRMLACLSHPERLRSEPKTRGNQKLIAEGAATPLEDADQLKAFLDRVKAEPISPLDTPSKEPFPDDLYSGLG